MPPVTGRQFRARPEKHYCFHLTRNKVTPATELFCVELFPQQLAGELDPIENGMVVIKLKFDEVKRVTRRLRLQKQVTPDLELFEDTGRSAATLGQRQTGEFAQPLGMMAEEFVKNVIGVHGP